METTLSKIRKFELTKLLKFLGTRKKILEIGGGNGFQAWLLSKTKNQITSIDIKIWKQTFYPIKKYNRKKLPFRKNSFDIIFTSHVLEHIKDLNILFSEMNRVLKPDGRCLHVLPSPTWRIFTSITYYIFMLKKIFKLFISKHNRHKTKVSFFNRSPNPIKLKSIIFPSSHGEYPSWISEIWYFSKKRWSKVFRNRGFVIHYCLPTRIFYTGYCILPCLPLKIRNLLSFLIGSSSFFLVAQKKADDLSSY